MHQLKANQNSAGYKPKPSRIRIVDGGIYPDICGEADPHYTTEHAAWTATLQQNIGVDDLYAATLLLSQVQKSCPALTGDKAEDLNIFLASLAEMRPLDYFEAQLCTQVIIVFDQAMALFGKANKAGVGSDASNGNLRLADRLVRTYSKLVETLTRYRLKGEQKIYVKHVSVQAGAQAVIGNVQGRG